MSDSFRPPEPKNVWFLLSRHDVRRVHEQFFSRRFELADGCQTHFGLLSPKTFDSYFLDMIHVEFMKNFLSPIRASWWVLDPFRPPERKTFDSYFLDMMYVELLKNFPLADSSELMGVRPISATGAQNVWFLLSRHDVRRVDEKFSSRRFEGADGC